MAATPARIYELSARFTTVSSKWKESANTAQSVHKLLRDIQTKVASYIGSKNPQESKEIIANLDTIRWFFDTMDEKSILAVIKDIQKEDGWLWRSYSWERIDTSDTSWNEDNGSKRFRVQWIGADDIVAIAKNRQKLYQEKPLVTIILTMVWVYWLTHEILRSIHNPKA